MKLNNQSIFERALKVEGRTIKAWKAGKATIMPCNASATKQMTRKRAGNNREP